MSEIHQVGETHGCIGCGRLFNLLVIAAPDGKLVDWTGAGSVGHIVPNEQYPLVACNIHTAEEIEAGYARWESRKDIASDDEQDKEGHQTNSNKRKGNV